MCIEQKGHWSLRIGREKGQWRNDVNIMGYSKHGSDWQKEGSQSGIGS